MREVSFSILVLGILFIRKVAWGRISRRLQYALWLLPFCYLLISSVWSVPSSFSIENGISRLAGQWKGTEADSMGTPETEVLSVFLGKVQGKQDGVDRQDSVAGQVGNGRQDATGRQEDVVKADGADKVVTDNLDSVGNQAGNDRQDSSDKQGTGKGIPDREDSGEAGNVFSRQTVTESGLATEGRFGKMLLYIRYGGTAGILLWMFAANVWFGIRCRKQRVYWGRDRQSGLKIYLLDSVTSPFLFLGNIYMGTDMTAEKTRFRHVVTHEMCHYRHGDNLWRLLRSLFAAFYWYNPFVWVAMEFARRDCELACDEAAVTLLGQRQAKDYGYTLLSIAGKKSKKGTYFTMATTMQGSTRKLAERIRILADRRNPSKAVTAGVLLLAVLLTGCTFTSGKEPSQEQTGQETGQTNLSGAAAEEVDNGSVTEGLSVESMESGGQTGQGEQAGQAGQTGQGEQATQTELAEQAMQKEMNEQVTQAEAGKTTQGEATTNIYNKVKYWNHFFYYVDTQGIKRIGENSKTVEVIVPQTGIHSFTLDKEGAVYYSLSSPEEAGIYVLPQGEQEPVKLIDWKKDYWRLAVLQAADGIIYLEMGDTCEAYQLQEDGVSGGRKATRLSDTENPVFQALERCGLSGTDIRNLPTGYSVALTEYQRMVLRLPEEQTLQLYDTQKGQRIAKLAECQNDILMMPQGVIYKKQTGDIYFQSWTEGENANQLLYQPAAYEGKDINYGTYDEGYLYGFWEEAGNSTLVRISFEDKQENTNTSDSDAQNRRDFTRKVQELNTFDGVNRAVDLGLSVNHGMISYWQDDKMVWEEPKVLIEEY